MSKAQAQSTEDEAQAQAQDSGTMCAVTKGVAVGTLRRSSAQMGAVLFSFCPQASRYP